jgi:hypothetical protein
MMKFTIAGNKIVCSRIDNTVEDADQYRQVVTFDAHLDVVPPHVGAKLTRREIEELEHFLADRKRIQANPAEANLLEALLGLLAESTEILGAVDHLNEATYQSLCESVAGLTAALRDVKPGPAGRVTPIRSMGDSEALKERLQNIRQDL